MAKRRFGASAEKHRDRAQSNLRQIRRVVGVVRRQLRSPPDCEAAASAMRDLLHLEGSYLIDKYEGARGGKGLISGYGGPRGLFDKACVVKPRSAAAARKMRAVWR